jgi:anti-sigma B factor antagonist
MSASRSHLRTETIDEVTVVSFVDTTIRDEEIIQAVGDELFSLVEDDGHSQLLLWVSSLTFVTKSRKPAALSSSVQSLTS